MKRKKPMPKDDGWSGWGGYMNAKVSKLSNQFNQDKTDQISDIFNGIAIFVNGLTDPPACELKRLMGLHGGVFNDYRTSKTTHIIASNLAFSKSHMIENYKFVTASWITDSIAQKKLLLWHNYKLQLKGSANQTTLVARLDQSQAMLTDGNPAQTNQNIDHGRPVVANGSEDNFLKEFYGRSRLHHISTMAQEFKNYVNEMRLKLGDNPTPRRFKGLDRLAEFVQKKEVDLFSASPKDKSVPVIMHIDIDCFFVSVGLKTRPEHRGKPIAVCHSRGGRPSSMKSGCIKINEDDSEDSDSDVYEDRGSMSEIASCSYEARMCGVTNGMLLGKAKKLCADLVTIPYDFEGYQSVAFTLYNTVAEYTLNIEAVSCDEMYVDCSEVLKSVPEATVVDFASVLRGHIYELTGCTCSAGMSSNRLLARMATKKCKPNGQYFLTSDKVAKYIEIQPVDSLPGVGWSLSSKLKALGATTCSDLQKIRISTLQNEFGMKTGQQLYNHCRGMDETKLKYDHERKSVSAEVNYGIRLKEMTELKKFLTELAEEVVTRMVKINVVGKMVTLKIKVRSKDAPVETEKFMGHGVCDNLSKSVTMHQPTKESSVIVSQCVNMLLQMNVKLQDLRGIGIQMQQLQNFNKDIHTHKPNNLLMNFLQKKLTHPKVLTGSKSKTVDPEIITLDSSQSKTDGTDISCTSQTDTKSDKLKPSSRLFDSVPMIKSPAYHSASKPVGVYKRGQKMMFDESEPCTSKACGDNGDIQTVMRNGIDFDSKPIAGGNESKPLLDSSEIDIEILKTLPFEVIEGLRTDYLSRGLIFPDMGPPEARTPSSIPEEVYQIANELQLRQYDRNSECPIKNEISPKKTNRGRPKKNAPKATDRVIKLESFWEKEPMPIEEVPVCKPVIEQKAADSAPNFAGLKDLDEIKSVIEEWLTTFNVPTLADVEIITQFLIDLVQCKNLEMAYKLMKFLLRKMNSCSSAWQDQLKTIFSAVQNAVITQYGYPLQL